MNGGGIRIGLIWGIPIRLHVSFLIVLPFLSFIFGQRFRGAARLAEVSPEALAGSAWLWGALLAVALFASVLLHELAHCFYALRKGGRVREITLLMIGGVSHITQPPRGHRAEAVMALVGPLTSVALAALSWAAHVALREAGSFNLQFAFFYLAGLNLGLGLFNLLPAFPLDGGRIVRGLLATRVGFARATRVAALLGKAFAVLFALGAFASGNLFLLLIAFVVWTGAAGEEGAARMKSLVAGMRVADVMTRSRDHAVADERVVLVADRMLDVRRTSLPVIERSGVVTGVVTLEAIQRVPPERRWSVTVAEAMTAVLALRSSDEVERALALLGEHRLEQLPVVDGPGGDQLVGMVGEAEISRGIRMRALEASQRHGPGRAAELGWMGRGRP